MSAAIRRKRKIAKKNRNAAAIHHRLVTILDLLRSVLRLPHSVAAVYAAIVAWTESLWRKKPWPKSSCFGKTHLFLPLREGVTLNL